MTPLPSRTSNHEALITFHEMGHYITNRLVGNATGLTNQQGRAMGEGWGDFFADLHDLAGRPTTSPTACSPSAAGPT